MEAEVIHEAPAATRIPWNKGKMIGSKPPLALLLTEALGHRLTFGETLNVVPEAPTSIDSRPAFPMA